MAKRRNVSVKMNAVLNVIKTISSIVFPLITFPYISRVLTVESIGAYNFGVSIVNYFILLAGLGISTYAIREGTQYRDDNKKMEKFSSEIFTINMISTIVAYILLVCCVLFVPKIHSYAVIIIVLGIEILFTTLGVNWLCNIYEDFLYITLRTIVFQTISLLALFIFVKGTQDLLKYIIIVVFASSGANLLNFFYIRKRYVKFSLVSSITKHIKPIMIIFFTNITITLYVSSDITILGFLSNDQQVGLYSAAVKIYTIIKNLLIAIVVVLIPRFSILLNTGDKENVNDLFSLVFKTIIVLLFPVTVGLFMTSTDVIHLVAGEKYLDAGLALAILSVATMFSMFAYMFTNCILIPLKKEKICLFSSIYSAIVNVGLNFIFIPVWGINAAAITTVVAEAIMCVVSVIYSRKEVVLKNTRKCILSTVVACFAIVCMCILLNSIDNYIIRLIAKIFGSSLVYVVIMILLKNEIFLEYFRTFKRILERVKNAKKNKRL